MHKNVPIYVVVTVPCSGSLVARKMAEHNHVPERICWERDPRRILDNHPNTRLIVVLLDPLRVALRRYRRDKANGTVPPAMTKRQYVERATSAYEQLINLIQKYRPPVIWLVAEDINQTLRFIRRMLWWKQPEGPIPDDPDEPNDLPPAVIKWFRQKHREDVKLYGFAKRWQQARMEPKPVKPKPVPIVIREPEPKPDPGRAPGPTR